MNEAKLHCHHILILKIRTAGELQYAPISAPIQRRVLVPPGKPKQVSPPSEAAFPIEIILPLGQFREQPDSHGAVHLDIAAEGPAIMISFISSMVIPISSIST